MFQGNVLGLVFYLVYTTDLPVTLGSITVTYMKDTVIFVAHNNHIEASLRL
jgi:hypothetical protein